MKRTAILFLCICALLSAGCKRDPHGGPEEFLKWSMDQHRDLKSFAGKGEWQLTVDGQPAQPKMRVVLYAAPNRFKILAGQPNAFSLMSVSDGKSQAEFSSDSGIPPIGKPAPSSLAAADTPFLEDPLMAGSLLYKMFLGKAGYTEIVDPSKGTPRYGGQEMLPSGEPGLEVKFYAKGPYGNVTMLIGEKSGLVRRIQYDSEPVIQQFLASQRAKSMDDKARQAFAKQRITEQYSELVANPDLSQEKFDAKVPDDVLAAHDRATAGPKMVGKPAPDFTLTSLDGKRLRLKDVLGKPVFIDFWATWCGPCRMSLPHTQDVYRKHVGKGEVLAITNEKPDVVRKFLKEQKLDIPVYLDPTGQVAKLYNVDPLPSFVLVDPKGKIVDYMAGFNEQRLKQGLDKVGLG